MGWMVGLATVALAATGCDDDADVDAGLPDLSVVVRDLATPQDLAVPDAAAGDLGAADGGGDLSSTDGAAADMMTLRCLQIVGCLQGCGDDATCQNNCVASGSMASQALVSALIACSYGVCIQATTCANDQDRTAPCRTCLSSAAASETCSDEFGACGADQ